MKNIKTKIEILNEQGILNNPAIQSQLEVMESMFSCKNNRSIDTGIVLTGDTFRIVCNEEWSYKYKEILNRYLGDSTSQTMKSYINNQSEKCKKEYEENGFVEFAYFMGFKLSTKANSRKRKWNDAIIEDLDLTCSETVYKLEIVFNRNISSKFNDLKDMEFVYTLTDGVAPTNIITNVDKAVFTTLKSFDKWEQEGRWDKLKGMAIDIWAKPFALTIKKSLKSDSLAKEAVDNLLSQFADMENDGFKVVKKYDDLSFFENNLKGYAEFRKTTQMGILQICIRIGADCWNGKLKNNWREKESKNIKEILVDDVEMKIVTQEELSEAAMKNECPFKSSFYGIDFLRRQDRTLTNVLKLVNCLK
ncbi:MAG: hypothetical protein Unbinned97contig1000_29 [Prokaryotic dsDNA virus sp.]|nr:MAG: hypothetical protein Unbinned97contig1000_29 [Prokaryotic dsDNA virus sp.]|tara:strand:- start:13685 stop:14770 length:1086 start_codon:yes stop_codon:yes gene_type:complete